MKADEYDEFIFDPTGFYLRKYLPRVCRRVRRLRGIPRSARPALFPSGRRHARFRPAAVARGAREGNEGRGGSRPFRRTACRLHRAHDGARLPYLAHQHLGLALRSGRRLFPRRHRHHEGSLPQQGQAAATAGQGLHVPDPANDQLVEGIRAPDRVLPDPLGARHLHVAKAVRDLLVADVPQADDQHDRRRHHPDAAVGGGLHQAAGDRSATFRRASASTGSSAPTW